MLRRRDLYVLSYLDVIVLCCSVVVLLCCCVVVLLCCCVKLLQITHKISPDYHKITAQAKINKQPKVFLLGTDNLFYAILALV